MSAQTIKITNEEQDESIYVLLLLLNLGHIKCHFGTRHKPHRFTDQFYPPSKHFNQTPLLLCLLTGWYKNKKSDFVERDDVQQEATGLNPLVSEPSCWQTEALRFLGMLDCFASFVLKCNLFEINMQLRKPGGLLLLSEKVDVEMSLCY